MAAYAGGVCSGVPYDSNGDLNELDARIATELRMDKY
jgi:hypothetical protein